MSAAPEGPQPRELLTCKGCKHFLSEYWRDPSGDGETYDSGTSAKCLKSDRRITSYSGSDPTPPDWCPCADLSPAPDIGALVEAAKPLAEMAERYDPPDGDDDLECWSGLAVPKIKHIRALRAALAALKGAA